MLKQRHDELPKLIEVCKGYMNFERDTLQKITEARSMYQRAVTIDQKAQADQTTTYALPWPLRGRRDYPELKANNNFMQLQTRITELESQIADTARVLQRLGEHLQHPHPGNAGYICGCVHEPETARDVQG